MSPCGLVGGQTSTGGPLTEFRRGRRSLPLPSERVKSPEATEERGVRWRWLPGGPLTDFGRGRPNLPLPSERVKSRAATEERGVRWRWLPGGPLTDFGRRRPNLPLPLERVKSRGPGGCRCLAWWVLGRALTDFRRRRRNPSASSGQVLPLPQARGGLAGCGSTRAHSTGSGQVLRRTPARLTMNGGYEYVGSGWWGDRGGTGALGLLGAAGSRLGTPG